ncbi:carbon-nitrogen hydrolase family protein [Primorskyibacter sp. S187A]|uniref:carbon-nitrogen hydrolase family protein n=1 Tax=Primorskyibacter sp. S187A TaxID=3415130 RepID=UPI003C7E68E3
MRVSLLQLNSSEDPSHNVRVMRSMLDDAVADGAGFALLPEVANCLGANRKRQMEVLQPEATDPTLAALREEAARHGIWLLIGSLALKTDDPDGRFANRSILISPEGEIAARYDKLHMFDVQLSETEQYQESQGYRPGTEAVIAKTPFATIGLSICYDLRFPYLYRSLAQAGAEILTVPAAFSYATGPGHWEPLLRARAIECGAWVLAPAQTGQHGEGNGALRRTHGHSLIVSPWGEVMGDAGTAPGVLSVELDMASVSQARQKIPALQHDREFIGPE